MGEPWARAVTWAVAWGADPRLGVLRCQAYEGLRRRQTRAATIDALARHAAGPSAYSHTMPISTVRVAPALRRR